MSHVHPHDQKSTSGPAPATTSWYKMMLAGGSAKLWFCLGICHTTAAVFGLFQDNWLNRGLGFFLLLAAITVFWFAFATWRYHRAETFRQVMDRLTGGKHDD